MFFIEKPLNWFFAKSPFANKLDLSLAQDSVTQEIERNGILLGNLLSKQNASIKPSSITSLKDVEFRVFSQFGEDGIIQYLISKIDIPNPIFVEFGVENYKESNTRFLLMANNWNGMVIDSSEYNVNSIQSSAYYWMHSICAQKAFITSENINDLISSKGIKDDIGILSIDIDSVDYWVWDSINIISPRIVICEWNGTFGPDLCVTVPKKNTDNRYKYHLSGAFFGASYKALKKLGQDKGYSLLGSNSSGNNLFFIRNDLSHNFINLIHNAEYLESTFCDFKDSNGEHLYISREDRLNLLSNCDIYDISQGKVVKLKSLL